MIINFLIPALELALLIVSLCIIARAIDEIIHPDEYQPNRLP